MITAAVVSKPGAAPHKLLFSTQAQDVENLKRFLTSKKPHVVAVAGENRLKKIIIKILLAMQEYKSFV